MDDIDAIGGRECDRIRTFRPPINTGNERRRHGVPESVAQTRFNDHHSAASANQVPN